MEHFRKAFVYVRRRFAGILEETDEGYAFTYDKDYLAAGDASPVSLTLPLRPETYTSPALFAFFDGLLPEGWLLQEAGRRRQLDTRDRFGVLLAACKDSIGNVTVEEERV